MYFYTDHPFYLGYPETGREQQTMCKTPKHRLGFAKLNKKATQGPWATLRPTPGEGDLTAAGTAWDGQVLRRGPGNGHDPKQRPKLGYIDAIQKTRTSSEPGQRDSAVTVQGQPTARAGDQRGMPGTWQALWVQKYAAATGLGDGRVTGHNKRE
ncbi:hypothetical protein BO71DRAFT_127173 [Aspergillus ellipticus CBS 707.79]|uniref:Uncharacterized protein n=1 Tax=Aspergillus ellipticus CBS 707.79 TaxID=1448320 RepID=A0A319CU60_9EURO|nr:hypothetical protein BO71DRAFT_127173 [Aspergillus ellipticus CBS 707.79]